MNDIPVTPEEEEEFERIKKQQNRNTIDNARASNDFKSHLVREGVNLSGIQSLMLDDKWFDKIQEA